MPRVAPRSMKIRFYFRSKSKIRRHSKKLQMQGAQIRRNAVYLHVYAAMTEDAAERRRWTFTVPSDLMTINYSKVMEKYKEK